MWHDLYGSALTLHFADAASPEHRLQGIILDISSNRLFKAVRVCDYTETKSRPFLKMFANKGIDALNFSNILNQKSVQSNSPHTFKTRSRHAFPIAILAQLLPNFFITKAVCSKSTSIVFPRIPYLVPALAQSFFMLYMTMFNRLNGKAWLTAVVRLSANILTLTIGHPTQN